MWIRTQDRKELLEIVEFKIQPITGGSYKASIFGRVKKYRWFAENSIELGQYITIEDGIKEIDDIGKFMIENSNEIYQVK